MPNLETEDGTLVSSAIRDVTERRRMETALRLSEQRSRLIVDTAYDAFVAIDSDGLITDWNAQRREGARQVVVGHSRTPAGTSRRVRICVTRSTKD
jgi:PAS domain-containing protein